MLRRLLALAFLQRGLSAALYLAGTVILARLLTPQQVGIFSLSAAFVTIATAIREFGIREYVLQARELDRAHTRAAFGVSMTVGWAVGCIVLLSRDLLSGFYDEPGVADVLTVMSLNFAFLPLATPMAALLYREMDIGRALLIQTVGVAATQLVSVSLAWLGLGYMALAWGAVAGSATQVLALSVYAGKRLWHLPSLRGSRAIWSYCVKYTAGIALESGARNAHEFVIGRRFGFAELGLYSRAAGLFEQFNQNVARGIARILLPSFAKDARQDASGLRERYAQATELYTAVAWPFFVFVAVMAPEIVAVLFGPQWEASGPLLRLMCVAAVVQSAFAFAGDMLSGFGRVGAKLRISSMTAPLWLVLCLLGSTVSVEAIALLTAGPTTLALILYSRRLKELLGFSFIDLVVATRRSALLALLFAVLCVAARLGMARLTGTAAVLFVGTGLVAGTAWLACAFALRHPIASEVAVFWKVLASRLATR